MRDAVTTGRRRLERARKRREGRLVTTLSATSVLCGYVYGYEQPVFVPQSRHV